MGSLAATLLSLVTAGAMMVTAPLEYAAPQHDIHGDLFLVNRDTRVSAAYIPELTVADVPGQVRQLKPEVAAALETMYAAAKEEAGVTLTSVSGYRGYGKQSSIYNRKLKSTGSRKRADEYVARPGASEHQMGFAMDVGQKGGKGGLTGSFGDTQGGIWLRDNCWRFGFIIRYPLDYEEITGYSYEPWHVRYIGREHAEAIRGMGGIPLEMYLPALRGERLLRLFGAQSQGTE